MRIGILDQTCPGWPEGTSYTRIILASLAPSQKRNGRRQAFEGKAEGDEVLFLAREDSIEPPQVVLRIPFTALGNSRGAAQRLDDLALDVVIPVRETLVREISTTAVGWIPDFQHYRMPNLFSPDDLISRDALFETIAAAAQLVLVFSDTVRRDFVEFFPDRAAKVRVAPFASTLWSAPLEENPQNTTSKYHIPASFVLVVNRFSRRNGQTVLLSALSILRQRGLRIPLVIAGLPPENSDTGTENISEFLGMGARLGLMDQVHLLGNVTYTELISIMRCAALVVNSSSFDDWSISMEDAKGLGRPLICSNIPIHREQAPDALGFFDSHNAEQLAALLAEHFPQLSPGPSFDAEANALAAAKSRSLDFGKALLAIGREAAQGSRLTEETQSSIRHYLQGKRSHLRYLVGNGTFRLKKLTRPSNCLRLLHDLSLKFHGMELGVLRQYEPRRLHAESIPTLCKEDNALPAIAIVTPSFNQGGIIAQTVESVIRQNYPLLEFGVIDGGSTDDTSQVLERYKANLAYCVSERDRGQSHAIAKGFEHLKGDIMGYLNSDDLLMPGSLRFVGEYFATHDKVDVIYGHRIVIDEDGQEVGRWILPPHDGEAIRNFDYVPQETLFWRKSLYEAVGGINQSFQFAMDWDLLLRFIQAGARFRRVPYFLACFRVHSKQKTHMLLDLVGERERARLMAREHPAGRGSKRVQQLQNSYRLRSSLCAALLRLGIRY